MVAITLAVGATLLGLSFSTGKAIPRSIRSPLGWPQRGPWAVSRPDRCISGHILSGGTLRRPIVAPIAVGLALAGIFALGAVVMRTIPPLASLAEDVLGYARAGNLAIIFVITLVNGVSEELFFRGALFAAIGVQHPVLISTVIYSRPPLPAAIRCWPSLPPCSARSSGCSAGRAAGCSRPS